MHKNQKDNNHEQNDNLNAEETKTNQPDNGIIEELISLKQENSDLKDKLLRTLADTENFKKRTEKQMEENSKYSVSNIVKDMLTILDNLDRATNAVSIKEVNDNELLKQFITGVEMTRKEFLNIFLKYGVIEIIPKQNDVFDHNLHQAVVHVDAENVESGKIVEMMQSGYKIFDRLLRAAMVTVAK